MIILMTIILLLTMTIIFMAMMIDNSDYSDVDVNSNDNERIISNNTSDIVDNNTGIMTIVKEINKLMIIIIEITILCHYNFCCYFHRHYYSRY